MLRVLVFALAIGVVVAYYRGRRFNRELTVEVFSALERVFSPVEKRYVSIANGVGYNFEYTLDGPFHTMRGIFTVLPRHAVLYLPLARFFGRRDLLKFTLFCDSLPLGFGHLVRDSALRTGWVIMDESERMQHHRITVEDETYHVFAYNPMFAATLEDLARHAAAIGQLDHVGCDHTENSIVVALSPRRDGVLDDLGHVRHLISRLTAH